MRNKIVRILPVITTLSIMVLIFLFSSQNSEDSSEVSGGLIRNVLDILPFTAKLAEAQKEVMIEQLHNIVRKCAHFTIYAALGASACAMFLLNMKRKGAMTALLLSAALCCVYAATDEFHQTFIDGRSGEIRDVIIDTCGGMTGAALALIVIWGICAIISYRRKKHDRCTFTYTAGV